MKRPSGGPMSLPSVLASSPWLRSLTMVLCSLLWVGPAWGYAVSLVDGDSGAIVKWPTKTATYSLHPECSEDLQPGECHQELRASFQQWSAPCSGLVFTEQEMSSNRSLTSVGGSTNGSNELAFIEDNAWYFGSFVLGVTGPVFSLNGDVIEADIAFNGLHHKWTMGSMGFATLDVMNVAVHEIGHYLGLQHALSGYDPNNPPTMAPTADNNLKSQTPEDDDLAGLCFLYPADTWSCSEDSDCPYILDQSSSGDFYHGILACEGGLCGGVSTEVPGGKVGEICVSDNDCEDELSCVSGLCSLSCVTDEDCPEPSICSGSNCVDPSAPSGPSPTGGDLTTCSSHFDCLSGAFGGGIGLGVCVESDYGGFCRTVCQSEADCAGAGCMTCLTAAEVIIFGEVTACVPIQGCSQLGDACTGDGECESALCLDRTCEQGCSVIEDNLCPASQACARFVDGQLDGICAPRGSLPADSECARDDLCESLLCVDGRCATLCDTESGEPCVGGACEAIDGGLALCAPGAGPAPPPEQEEGSESGSGGGDGGGCQGAPGPDLPSSLLLSLGLLAVFRRARRAHPEAR